jgi:hypothetical protein
MVDVFRQEPDVGDIPNVTLQPETSLNGIENQTFAPGDGFFLSWMFGQTDPDPFADFSSFPVSQIDYPSSSSEEIDPFLEPIISDLERLHTTCAATDLSYDGTFEAALAKQIFTRSNRETFLPTYFRYTHIHMPLVHRPSFSAETSSPALVLAIFLCGALYSPPRDCVLAIPAFYRVAEEYIFRKLDAQVKRFQQRRGGEESSGDAAEDLVRAQEMEVYETLQAALLIHGAQFLMNTGDARSRSWKVRGTIADAVRKLELTRARHTQGGGGTERVDWARFIRDETRIR